MSFWIKFLAKTLLNALALYVVSLYFSGFVIGGGVQTIIIGGLLLAVLNSFLRPIIRLISAPIVWLTFGLFNLVINMFVLWLADRMLTELTIADLPTLFWASIILALANAFF